MRVLLCVVATFAALALAAQADLVNVKVDRSVDAQSFVVHQVVTAKVKNSGSSAESNYVIAVPADRADNVAFVKVLKGGKLGAKAQLENGAVSYPVEFSTPLAGGEEATVKFEIAFVNYLSPFPASIRQDQHQSVKLEDSAYFYTPYATQKQSSRFAFADSKFESYTEEIEHSQDENELTYGPFTDVAAFAVEPVQVHVGFSAPMLRATRCVREIEISHWGNVAVEEHYDVYHAGAKLSGHFSRVDYQRQPDVFSGNVITHFHGHLPATARDIYYRDVIGNISTSELKDVEDGVEMTVRPRFPMFGGWKTSFIVGYNLDIGAVLQSSGSRRRLQTSFGSTFSDFVCDEQETRVILPEMSSDFMVHLTGFALDDQTEAVMKTYLDTVGRPVLIAKKQHATAEVFAAQLTVMYTFGTSDMAREPIMLILGILLFHLCVMAYVRFENPISKAGSYAEEQRDEELRFLCDDFLNALEHREDVYEIIKETISGPVKAKQTGRVDAIKEKAKNAFHATSEKMNALVPKIVAIHEPTGQAAKRVLDADHARKGAYERLLQASQDVVRGDAKAEGRVNSSESEIDACTQEIADAIEHLA